tara:strand:+ start:1874 stop:2197 length:324 start_codon:yes stop_codon:yes gene_type:complete
METELFTDEARVIGTGVLTDYVWDGWKHNRNRQATKELLTEVDPEGRHLLGFSMIHNDIEFRGQWFVKIKDQDDPVEVWLDIGLELYGQQPPSVVRRTEDGDWVEFP